MTPFDLLTEEELSLMDTYRRVYVPRGDKDECFNDYCSMDYLLRKWNDKKQPLLKLFGNKLILEKKISYKEKEENLINELREMLRGKVYGKHSALPFTAAYRDKIRQVVDSTSAEYLLLMRLITPNALLDNSYDGPDFTVDSLVIKNGIKTIKALSKLAFKWQLEGFEDFRICHSVVLNSRIIKGTLCLSIHPFDYWTMSDNSNGWSSCMSWGETKKEDYGCYRQGTVECMNSPATIIAYLKDAEDFNFAFDSYWNSKKWRQLVTFDCNCIFAIKGYPFQNDELSTMVVDWLRELASDNLGEEYLPVVEKDSFIELEGRTLEFQLETCKMYCDQNALPYHWFSVNSHPDFLKSYSYSYSGDKSYIFYIEESGSSECMVCGELTDCFSDEGQLACDDCSYSYCEFCSDVIYDNERKIILSDGRVICLNCFEQEGGFECSECGEFGLLEDDIVVYEAVKGEEDTIRFGEIVADCCCERCANSWGKYNTKNGQETNAAKTRYGTFRYVFADELESGFYTRGEIDDYDDPIEILS